MTEPTAWDTLFEDLIHRGVLLAEDRSIFLAAREKSAHNAAVRASGEGTLLTIPADRHHDGSERTYAPQAGYRCYTCHDSGFVRKEFPVGHAAFGRAFPCPHLTESGVLQAQRLQQRLARAALPAPLLDCSLASFAPVQGASRALSHALAFVQAIRAQEPAKWLLFVGPPGCGKTHLCAGITLACCVSAEVQALYWDTRNLLSACKRLEFQDEDRHTSNAIEAPVLVLDEFLAQHDIEWDKHKLESILGERYVRQQPTVIASSRPVELLQAWSPALYSRLRDDARGVIVQMTAPDYRLAKGA